MPAAVSASRAGSTSAAATVKPAAAQRRAATRPTPLAAPATNATRSVWGMRLNLAIGVARRALLQERGHPLAEVVRLRAEDLVAVLHRDHLLETGRVDAGGKAFFG